MVWLGRIRRPGILQEWGPVATRTRPMPQISQDYRWGARPTTMRTAYRTMRSRTRTQKRPIPQCGRLYRYRCKRLRRPRKGPKVPELKERLINAYPRLFSGVANKTSPDRGRFCTARIKLKPNPKIFRHREYQLQGDLAEAMKKLLAEFLSRAGSNPPTVSGPAQPLWCPGKRRARGGWWLITEV